MLALVTGASSGIGFAIATELLERGYDILAVSRTEGRLDELRRRFPEREIAFLPFDLTSEEACFRLLKETEGMTIDVFVDSAGFGDIGFLEKTSLSKEIDMVKLNDIATLILGKSFLLRFLEKGKGKLLFVSSAASFGPAPYMSLYHATKAFVTYLVHGYHRELKRRKSSVSVSLLLPGPVDSGFAKAAGMTMRRKAMDPAKVARKAVDGLFAGRLEIVPGLWMKTVHLFSHVVPKRVITRLVDKSSEIGR